MMHILTTHKCEEISLVTGFTNTGIVSLVAGGLTILEDCLVAEIYQYGKLSSRGLPIFYQYGNFGCREFTNMVSLVKLVAEGLPIWF